MVIILFFFFFQAEDGIRYIGVTGVQTCALPISAMLRSPERTLYGPSYGVDRSSSSCTAQFGPPVMTSEANSRWMPYFTSAEVSGEPSAQVSPGRRVYVQVRPPSVLRPGAVARSGTVRAPCGPGSGA